MRVARFDFSGSVVLVTGGGTGIGEGIARAFARAGAKIVVGGRRREPLERVCADFPQRAACVQMDVGVANDRARALDFTIERFGQLDVLVNNAISRRLADFERQTSDDIAELYRVLLAAPTELTRLALPHLQRTGGVVINISSVGGRFIHSPSQGLSVYSAAKAGLNQLTRALGSELARSGVRVNAVAPGITRTESLSESGAAMGLKATPMGRIGEPADVADVALFLASDAARWVTGQVIDASGGYGISG